MARSSSPSLQSVRSPAPRAWQRMLSGRRLNLLDPSPLDIEIEDIAHGLARVGRWNGQTIGPHIYSVAQHSLLVDAIAGEFTPSAGPKTRLAVFLHDAAEYVVGDMISPFKAAIGDAYKETELRILDCVMRRFSLPAPMPRLAHDLSKKADRAAAFVEATALAGFTREEAEEFFGPAPRLTRATLALAQPWPVSDVEARFLARFDELDQLVQVKD